MIKNRKGHATNMLTRADFSLRFSIKRVATKN